MVFVTIDGEKKKVACGPCIRGHRSTKCEHRDRILIEVRKPGRPLSGCPHPAGGCGCERTVINYVIPKELQCTCPSDPEDAPEAQPIMVSTTPSARGSANRVQKSRRKKSGTVGIMNPPPNPITTPSPYSQSDPPRGTPSRNRVVASRYDSSNGGSPNSSNASSDSESQARMQDPSELQAPLKQEDTPKLRLGMLGVGGYQAGPDEIGWKGDWPDAHAAASEDSRSGVPPDANAKPSCCGGRKLAPKQAPLRESPRQSKESPQSTAQSKTRNNFLQGPLGFLPHAHANDAFAQPWPQLNGVHAHVPPYHASMNQDQAGLNFQPASMEMNHNDLNGESANCHCGDNCSCLGCAEHPANETTINYVRDATAHMLNFPTVFPSQNQFGVGNGQQRPEYPSSFGPSYQNFSPAQFDALQGVPPPQLPHPQAPLVHSMDPNMWPPMSMGGHAEGMLVSSQASEGVPGSLNGSSNQGSSVELEPDSTSGFEEQLSPSLYSFGAFELHGCGEAQGACQCGSGCDCVGCLTHTGHGSVGDLPTSQHDSSTIGVDVTNGFG